MTVKVRKQEEEDSEKERGEKSVEIKALEKNGEMQREPFTYKERERK